MVKNYILTFKNAGSTIAGMTQPEGPTNAEAAREHLLAPIKPVIDRAYDVSREYRHVYTGTEHLLIALVTNAEQDTLDLLGQLKLNPQLIDSKTRLLMGMGENNGRWDPVLTPRAKKVIEISLRESRADKSDQIERRHLLLGLFEEGEGIACGILEYLGVGRERLRAVVLKK